jgi:Fe-S-cluster containining protein
MYFKTSDKDKPYTWVKYKEGLCNQCQATCCTMPLEVKKEDIIRMELATEADFENSISRLVTRLQKEGVLQSYRANTELFMISRQANGDCVFLTKEKKCSIYDKRPETCRKFPLIGLRPGFCPANPRKI